MFVGINKFKEKIREEYDNWFKNEGIETTKSGKLRKPPLFELLKWIRSSSNSLTSELIKKSFKVCGINIYSNGCEDSKITCLNNIDKNFNGFELLCKKQKKVDSVISEDSLERRVKKSDANDEEFNLSSDITSDK